jgi:hypothetical protein
MGKHEKQDEFIQSQQGAMVHAFILLSVCDMILAN